MFKAIAAFRPVSAVRVEVPARLRLAGCVGWMGARKVDQVGWCRVGSIFRPSGDGRRIVWLSVLALEGRDLLPSQVAELELWLDEWAKTE